MNYQLITEIFPLPILIVDEDVRTHYLNPAAEKIFRTDNIKVLNQRCGEVFHCLHAFDVPEGCGRGPFCKTCIIRNSVKRSISGKMVTRKRVKVELVKGERKKASEWLITTSPFPDSGNKPLVLLIIEDITELIKLRDIIPICAKCKRIRDDQDYWHSVEDYFNDYIGIKFSHGICPECMRALYPELAKKKSN
ncbi:MAG: PAS domain-containing protein [Desulfobacterota bacterium]|nr:PAS domain-containing protein [Thermodesulfobacteriota bacterium]